MSSSSVNIEAETKYYHPYLYDSNLIENNMLLNKLRGCSTFQAMPRERNLKTISPLLISTKPILCDRCAENTTHVVKQLKKQTNINLREYSLNSGVVFQIPNTIYGKQDLLLISKLCKKCQINWEFRAKSSEKAQTSNYHLKKSDSRIGL
eukprot:NODE_86_length_22075_cov_1.190253.p16 type:complete len:150 gc:universal NODE_86_length_22075_cov_1.190253:17169-16720(-)